MLWVQHNEMHKKHEKKVQNYIAACKKCNTMKKTSELKEICSKCQLQDVMQNNKVTEPPRLCGGGQRSLN